MHIQKSPPSYRIFFSRPSSRKNTARPAAKEYSCEGCSAPPGNTAAAKESGGNLTAHDTHVGVPKQQPFMKHPSLVIASPRANDGATTSHTSHTLRVLTLRNARPPATAASTPPYIESPPSQSL